MFGMKEGRFKWIAGSARAERERSGFAANVGRARRGKSEGIAAIAAILKNPEDEERREPEVRAVDSRDRKSVV